MTVTKAQSRRLPMERKLSRGQKLVEKPDSKRRILRKRILKKTVTPQCP